MSDFEKLINASDLIEWIIETDPDWCVGSVRCIIDHIDKMPSAQPETHEERTETHSCDLISRQAAMEEISKQQTYKMFEGEDTLYLDANDVGSVLASLPSAQSTMGQVFDGDTINRQAAIECDGFREVERDDERRSN